VRDASVLGVARIAPTYPSDSMMIRGVLPSTRPRTRVTVFRVVNTIVGVCCVNVQNKAV